ncbi:MAG TPA: YkgJ family cysteine cluster protein [Pirellulales bacterium]|nr:YkgJ family cysteine cluster protein [Pirellulales bacterium]
MPDQPHASAELRQATLELNVSGRQLQLEMAIPVGPVRPMVMLPILQALANTFVGAAVQNVEDDGLSISCTKGCGACCRQLVPIAEVEAHRLRDVVAAMPEARRGEVLRRFAEARMQFHDAGLLDQLAAPQRIAHSDLLKLGLDYFAVGVACPFLDEESCSIHPDRPIACREYLVTSPAANCAHPTAETVRCVHVAAKVSSALPTLGTQQTPWIPLVLALEWADAHADEPAPRPGTEIIREVFSRITGKDIPNAPPASGLGMRANDSGP